MLLLDKVDRNIVAIQVISLELRTFINTFVFKYGVIFIQVT